MPRDAHLVGSLPGNSAAEAMSTALDVLGPHLRSLPDGETGERRNWVQSIINSLRDHPALEVRKDGDWSDYDKTPQLRIRKGRRLYGANLDFGHVDATRQSFPEFERLKAERGLADLVFQQGVPGDLDMAMFTLGPNGALRHRRPFTEATLAEIKGVAAISGPDTLFQIEVPAELTFLAKAPGPARPQLARVFARAIVGLAAASPPGTRFAVHLCLGDMNNRAFATMGDVTPLVLLCNAITSTWPADRPLELVHAPFAAPDHPGSTDPAFYAPLSGLELQPDIRFAAGIAHEAQDLGPQRGIRDMIEDRLVRHVAIAAACGLGRRSEQAARANLERTAELCDD
ncbi:MAG TPA: hypothetical protein VH395_00250 [Jatrophihabitantaceae bacterium]